MHHDQHLGVQHRPEGAHVHIERVYESNPRRPAHLYEGYFRKVGALPVELRVDGQPRLPSDLRQEGLETLLGVDQTVLGGRGRTQTGSPESTVFPASSQAVVPPTTLTASVPSSRRSPAATRLRPPFAQIT